jgi:Domain of unknown function (DUF5658)
MNTQIHHQRVGILRRDLIFARYHLWFIAASALDIVMTALVLSIGGYEANPVAGFVIHRFGMHGALAYKFTLAVLVIVFSEIIGRTDLRKGRFVARTAIAVPTFAALLGYVLIVYHAGTGDSGF